MCVCQLGVHPEKSKGTRAPREIKASLKLDADVGAPCARGRGHTEPGVEVRGRRVPST